MGVDGDSDQQQTMMDEEQQGQSGRRTRATAKREQLKSQTPVDRSPSPGNSNSNSLGRECSPGEPSAKRTNFADFEGATTRSSILPVYHDRMIRVGGDYQASVTSRDQWMGLSETDCLNTVDTAICFWVPDDDKLSDRDLEEFCTSAKAQFGYNVEQALGLLNYHNHDMDKALMDMGSYVPYSEEWSTEDKVLFDQAYQNYGKNFHKIRQLIPHKSLSALVEYYYLWKKTRGYSSYMDRDRESDEYDEDDEQPTTTETATTCENCEQRVNKLSKTAGGMLCVACSLYFKRNNSHRPCEKRTESPVPEKGEKCPPGFEKSMDQFTVFARRLPASSDDGKPPITKGEDYIKKLEYRINTARTKSLRLGGELDKQYQRKLGNGIDTYRIPGRFKIRPNPRWTDDETLLVVQGFSRYGKDFEAIAEMLTTKTLEMVQEFYRENQTKYNLDLLIRECEEQKKVLETELKENQRIAETNRQSAGDVIDITDE